MDVYHTGQVGPVKLSILKFYLSNEWHGVVFFFFGKALPKKNDLMGNIFLSLKLSLFNLRKAVSKYCITGFFER